MVAAMYWRIVNVSLSVHSSRIHLSGDAFSLRDKRIVEESPDSMKATVPGNARPGKPEGKRHRNETTLHAGKR